MEADRRRTAKSPGRRWLSTLLGVVLCIVFGVLLVCNLIIIVKGTLQPERPPDILGITPLVVLSGSMSGTQAGHIETGDLIFVRSVDPQQLQPGDTIAYMNGQTTITHRITAVETGEDGELLFTTKGDANQAEDTEPVTADQVVGIYQGRIPKVGDFALFLQQPLGMLLFIGVPLFGFIFYDILRRQRYAKIERQKAHAMEEELERLRSQMRQDEASSSQDQAASQF